MSKFNTHNAEELSDGNRYFWKIPNGLPIHSKRVTLEFILHDKRWEYVAYYSKKKFFRIEVNSISEDKDYLGRLVIIRVGIIGDDQKELALVQDCDFKREGKLQFLIADLISRSKLNDLMLKNKVLYIFVEMKRVNGEKAQSIQELKNSAPKVETDFKEMLLTGRNSDVTIKVQRRKFKCHRCILGARSPVFSAMMEHDMKEKASGEVIIKDAESTVFQEFLLFLYTGNKEHLNWKNVIDLYKLGDKYDVEDLKSLCVNHIKEALTMVNFYELFLLSQQHNDSELKDITVKFFLKNSKEIVGSNDWMKFLSKNLVESNVLITALANK